MGRGGMTARIHLVPSTESSEQLKANSWSQVYPLRSPARGMVGFNFDRNDNQLLSITFYYARFCLPRKYSDNSEYFVADEPSETRAMYDGWLLFIDLADIRGPKNLMSQFIELREPASGTVILDYLPDATIRSIEILGFSSRSAPIDQDAPQA